MILGRPTNQWIGLVTAAGALVQVLILQLVPDVDAVEVATIIGSVIAFLGVLIAFVANQAPTVAQGDTINVVTPEGQPNKTITA
jgi:uncharacterized membrane protein YkvI